MPPIILRADFRTDTFPTPSPLLPRIPHASILASVAPLGLILRQKPLVPALDAAQTHLVGNLTRSAQIPYHGGGFQPICGRVSEPDGPDCRLAPLADLLHLGEVARRVVGVHKYDTWIMDAEWT